MKSTGSKIKNMATQTRSDERIKSMAESIANLLAEKGMDESDLDAFGAPKVTHRVVTDDAGNSKSTVTTAIQLSPKWEQGPQWPIVTPGPTIRLQKPKAKPAKTTGWESALIIPDIQIGYYRKSMDAWDLEPIHDEKAIEISLAIARKYQPDQIIMVGDNLDFAEFGSFDTEPAFKQMVQPTIDRGTLLCAQFRDAAPHAKIVWIQGNHEQRLPRYQVRNFEAAHGITVGRLPDEARANYPLFSVPVALRMDEFDITYLSGYPENRYFINSNLMVVHGDKVVSNNSTTKKYLDNERISVIYGHIHRNEVAYRTRATEDGPRTIMAASPGCLCRIDGAVPSAKSGRNDFGLPIYKGAENWQQGLAMVQYQPKGVGGEYFSYEPMWIFDGRGNFRGEEYKAD